MTFETNSTAPMFFIASLAKEGYVFGMVGLSVSLFVCLLVSNITQNLPQGFVCVCAS